MPNDHVTVQATVFEMPRLQEHLDDLRSDPSNYDLLEFGLIAMDLDGTVIAYNRLESQYAGLQPARVLGLNFFTDVAPCTNNYMVSGRFEDEPVLDEIIAYVFTLKMRPSPVQLRMLKDERAGRQYLAVKW